ncbi:MAG: DNA repair protein RecO [Proteobacteria bacterium]|nr:DNA repair protein RecO [Pseudomonadota bacterium]MBI3499894.1 DNA repair protein RecO [Pseudomonadota bacterium]
MDWNDRGIVLAARPHGESGLIVSLLTREHGRHAGLVRGGAGKARALYEPGNVVAAIWRGRLSEHLGSWSCEPVAWTAARLIDDPLRLACLASACAVAETALPEREPHAGAFDGMLALIEAFEGPVWDAAYVRWELGLLSELGFGLDLSRCAASGAEEGLAFVSPRTGRAVSLLAGEPFRDRLLTLPGFLVGLGGGGKEEVAQGLALTGYFLERHVLAPHHRPLPAARTRFVDRFQSTSTISSDP